MSALDLIAVNLIALDVLYNIIVKCYYDYSLFQLIYNYKVLYFLRKNYLINSKGGETMLRTERKKIPYA